MGFQISAMQISEVEVKLLYFEKYSAHDSRMINMLKTVGASLKRIFQNSTNCVKICI